MFLDKNYKIYKTYFFLWIQKSSSQKRMYISWRISKQLSFVPIATRWYILQVKSTNAKFIFFTR